MATQTTNYNLVKPSYNENADIAVVNGNMDIIDTKIKEVEDKTNSNSVEWNQLVNSGTKIAEITVGGNKKDVYAPAGGGGSGGSIVVDSELSEASENPVQNKVITAKLKSLVGDIVSDAYDNTKTYKVNDYCIYDDKLYKCKTAITTAEEFNLEHWNITSINSELSLLVSNSLSKNTFNVDWSGRIKDCNDMVNGIYSSLAPAHAPLSGSHWVTVISIPANGASAYNMQIAMVLGENTLYTRYSMGGTWSAWKIH